MTQGPAALSPPQPLLSQGVHDERQPHPATSSIKVVGQPVAAPAASTLKLYAGEWAAFVAWCRHNRQAFLPASGETLAAFLLATAPVLSRGALGRRRAAIGAMHRLADMPVPHLDAASRKALRAAAKSTAAGRRGAALTSVNLVRIAGRCPRDLAGLRDRALLLLVGATQRRARGRGMDETARTNYPDSVTGIDAGAEVPRLVLLGLQAEDVRFTASGAVLQLKSRTDDPIPSRTVTLTRATTASVCPVRALEDWLRRSDTTFGPVFRKVDRWGNVEHACLGPDAWYRILARRRGASSVKSRRKTAI